MTRTIIERRSRTVNTDKNAMIHWPNIFNYWYFSLDTDKFIILLIKWLNYWPNPIVTDHQLFYWQFNFFTDHLHLILIKFYWSFIIKYWSIKYKPYFIGKYGCISELGISSVRVELTFFDRFKFTPNINA